MRNRNFVAKSYLFLTFRRRHLPEVHWLLSNIRHLHCRRIIWTLFPAIRCKLSTAIRGIEIPTSKPTHKFLSQEKCEILHF